MSLRYKLTYRFTVIVFGILALSMIFIYGFTAYFIKKNFYNRLHNRAETVANWISQTIDKQEEVALLKNLLYKRKDQLPNEDIFIYDAQNQLIYATSSPLSIQKSKLDEIRDKLYIEFHPLDYEGVGIYFQNRYQSFVVVAIANNIYGDTFLQQLRWIMFALMVFSILIISLIGWLNAKKTLEPIEQIGKKLNQVFPSNLNQRIVYPNEEDEIGQLTLVINHLLDRIEDGLLIQKMFIGNVSHELQNPLTRITSQLEVSLLKERSSAEYQKTIRSVFEDISELIALTKNLLKLSKINAENHELLVNNFRIDELIFDVQDTIHRNFSGYSMVIELGQLPDEPEHLCMMGNYALMKVALLNLVENACKFSLNNKAVVSLFCDAHSKKISITDNGIGISSEELPHIFHPFYRSQKKAQAKGYGIGLSIVERIINIHKANIEVESTIGEGTSFIITFNKQ